MIIDNSRIVTENNKIIENLGVYAVRGLRFWHDASTIALNDGDKIPNVIEKSGSGFNFVQGEVKRQPVFRENRINGLPSMSFELNTSDYPLGSQGTLFGSRNGSQSFFNGRVIEFFWVGKYGTLLSNSSLFLHIRSASANNTIIFRILPTNRFSLTSVDSLGNTVITTLSTTLNPNQWYIFYGLVDLSGTFNRTLSVEGVGSTSVTSSNSFVFSTAHNFRLSGSGNTSDVEVAESIITSNTAPMSSNDKSIIINYFKTKYGL